MWAILNCMILIVNDISLVRQVEYLVGCTWSHAKPFVQVSASDNQKAEAYLVAQMETRADLEEAAAVRPCSCLPHAPFHQRYVILLCGPGYSDTVGR
jgi:hypothetical protein